MYEIVNVNRFPKGLEACVKYVHSKWGSESNYAFYLDAMKHSSEQEDAIPQFYVLVHDHEIVGCFGLIINDFVSRHDLYPWLCCLFIEPDHRGKRLSERLLNHGLQVASAMGYAHVYLSTDHDQLYEKLGWERMEDAFEPSGEPSRVYRKSTP